jgi:hypothetical protein
MISQKVGMWSGNILAWMNCLRNGLTRHGSGQTEVVCGIGEVTCRRCILPLDSKK